MFDEKKQVLEIIKDFKSLSSKIRDKNVKIKGTLTKNEITIQPVKKNIKNYTNSTKKFNKKMKNLSNILLIYNNSYNKNNKGNLNNFKRIKIDISIN